MDRIRLRGVRAYGRHGTEAHERKHRQLFVVDLDAEIDLRPAAASDDLANTLNYAALHRRLVRIVSTTSYALLERLAGRLLDEVFADNRVARAELTVSKPEILAGATPSVTLARDNPRHEPAE
ncbi:MAG TPA: dihydroneopterin aldolase [Candidatus Babeliales bacterium]|nr:dihydroneopterin aldolase [Candidatus Babeliales bacterium]